MSDSDMLSVYADSTKYYIKYGVLRNEYAMQQHIYSKKLVNAPKIIVYNEAAKCLVMERVSGMTIADMYGESFNDVPLSITKTLAEHIHRLYKAGIIYNDITGYNVMEDATGKIWILDYEHAKFKKDATRDEIHYVRRFIKGKQGWNAEYI